MPKEKVLLSNQGDTEKLEKRELSTYFKLISRDCYRNPVKLHH